MKNTYNLLVLICLLLFVSCSSNVTNEDQELIDVLDKIELYAVNYGSYYSDFTILTPSQEFEFKWQSTTSLSFLPEMEFTNLIPGEEVVAIPIVSDHGTSVLSQEIHLINLASGIEYDLMSYSELIDTYITVHLSDNHFVIYEKLNGSYYDIDTSTLGIEDEHIFENINFDNYHYYEIANNELLLHISAQVSPSEFPVDIIAHFSYTDDSFIVTDIYFEELN